MVGVGDAATKRSLAAVPPIIKWLAFFAIEFAQNVAFFRTGLSESPVSIVTPAASLSIPVSLSGSKLDSIFGQTPAIPI